MNFDVKLKKINIHAKKIMNYKSRIIRESQEAFAGLKKLGVIKEAKSFKGRLFKTINAFMKNLEN